MKEIIIKIQGEKGNLLKNVAPKNIINLSLKQQ